MVVGWPQKSLFIDLTRNKIVKKHMSVKFARQYLGARGFNSRMLFDLVGPETDALDPGNVLLFGTGPLNGTLVPGAAKFNVTAKSPLTDILGSSSSTGLTELRFAGYSQVVFFGKAQTPVYVWIDDDSVEIRDASRLWGRNTWDTDDMIAEELGDPSVCVARIGQAGENLVRYSCVLTGQKSAAARTGMGAVMGSKNLKALAVRGTKGITPLKAGEFQALYDETLKCIERGLTYKSWSTYGSCMLMEVNNTTGAMGVKNFTSNVFSAAEKLGGERLKNEFSIGMKSCFSCPIHCRPFFVVREGKYAGACDEGIDYGITQIAPWLDIHEMEPILHIYNLLNQYGIDSVSFAANIGWAMECYEKGIITKEITNGLPLKWGDSETVIQLIHLIAKREGFGKILAEGEKRAPMLVGRGSEKYMYHVKGMTPVIEDPRVMKGFGLGYYTSTRGGDHLRALYMRAFGKSFVDNVFPGIPGVTNDHVPDGKGICVKWLEDYCAVLDSACVCKRPWLNVLPDPLERMPELLARFLAIVTGFHMNAKELLRVGERIYNVEKAFNSREGLTRRDDDFTNPEKFTKEPVGDGPAKGLVFERDKMLDEYYRARGWDPKTGLQTETKLKELSLGELAKELKKNGKIA